MERSARRHRGCLGTREPGRRRHGRRRRDHRFGRDHLARRSLAPTASSISRTSWTISRAAYDDYGHGTHVAGIIAGSGYDSDGARAGHRAGRSLVVLKVLDSEGNGYISNVIAALDYAVENRARFNIRVMNLSVAAGVYESYNTDPLTLAARRAVEAGIVVVTAAGNLGRNAKDQPQYGGIRRPGNAPWVLTVGAVEPQGHRHEQDRRPGRRRSVRAARAPSTMPRSRTSSRRASASNRWAKPAACSFATHPAERLWGTVDTATPPYLSLSGTSMAAPVVAGTVALMLQANPALTPNLVKAVLQYTAEHRAGYDDLTQGAGFLNARGAVQLARSLSGDPGRSEHAQGSDAVERPHQLGQPAPRRRDDRHPTETRGARTSSGALRRRGTARRSYGGHRAADLTATAPSAAAPRQAVRQPVLTPRARASSGRQWRRTTLPGGPVFNDARLPLRPPGSSPGNSQDRVGLLTS